MRLNPIAVSGTFCYCSTRLPTRGFLRLGMTRLRKFLHLPSSDRRLLLHAVILHGMIRLGLWILPFGFLRRVHAVLAQTPRGEFRGSSNPDRVVWAVGVASQYGGIAGTCLSQALTAHVLLTWNGHPADLCIGVARGTNGKFRAHAWVESQGRIVIGGRERWEYSPLRPLPGHWL